MAFRAHFLVLAALFAVPAHAQDDAYAKRVAYKYALRCFAAGGVAVNMPSENPGRSRTAAIRAYAKKSYDTAFQMGHALGYADREIGADLDRAQQVDVPALMRDSKYFAETKAACLRLGLMA